MLIFIYSQNHSLFIGNELISFLHIYFANSIKGYSTFFSFFHLLYLFLERLNAFRKKSRIYRAAISKYIKLVFFADFSWVYHDSWDVDHFICSFFTFYWENIGNSCSSFLSAFNWTLLTIYSWFFKIFEESMNKFMDFGSYFELVHQADRLVIGLWTKWKNFCLASGCLWDLAFGNLSHIWLQNIDWDIVFCFDSFDDSFELLMHSFFNASIWKLQNNVKIVNIFSNIDQKLVDVLFMIFEFNLFCFYSFFDGGILLCQHAQLFNLVKNLLLFFLELRNPRAIACWAIHWFSRTIIQSYFWCLYSFFICLFFHLLR